MDDDPLEAAAAPPSGNSPPLPRARSLVAAQLAAALAAADAAAQASLLLAPSRSSKHDADARQALWDAAAAPAWAAVAARPAKAAAASDPAARAGLAAILAAAAAHAGAPQPHLRVAHLAVLAKALAVLRALAVQSLLDGVPAIANEIAFWDARIAAPSSVILYAAETLPARIAALVARSRSPPSDSNDDNDNDNDIDLPDYDDRLPRPPKDPLAAPPPLSDSAAAADTAPATTSTSQDFDTSPSSDSHIFHGSRIVTHLGLGIGLRIRPPPLFDAIRSEMAANRQHLVLARLCRAQCLGILARSAGPTTPQIASQFSNHHPAPSSSNAHAQTNLNGTSVLLDLAAADAGSPFVAAREPALPKVRAASNWLARLVPRRKPKHASPPTASKTTRIHSGPNAQQHDIQTIQHIDSKTASEILARAESLLRAHVINEIAVMGATLSALLQSGPPQIFQLAGDMASLVPNPQTKPLSTPIDELYADVGALSGLLKDLTPQTRRLISQFGRPSLILRAWLPTVAITTTAIVIARNVSRESVVTLITSFTTQLWSTLEGFVTNWVVQPFHNVITTIRHDETRLAMLGTQSVATDIASLERMVVDYARDHGAVSVTDPSALADLARRVREGDLTVILQHYEEDIKRPLYSAMSGDLIRSLLIQIQKAKLDGELAVSALDKLLRSNELNFALLAVMPAMAVSYIVCGWIYRVMWSRHHAGVPLIGFFSMLSSSSSSVSVPRAVAELRTGLRDTERLFNRMELGDLDATRYAVAQGLLLFEIYHLRERVMQLPDTSPTIQSGGYGSSCVVDRGRLDEDVRDLESVVVYQTHRVSASGIAILNRIWRTHGILRQS